MKYFIYKFTKFTKFYFYAGDDLKPHPLRGALFQIVTDTAQLKIVLPFYTTFVTDKLPLLYSIIMIHSGAEL